MRFGLLVSIVILCGGLIFWKDIAAVVAPDAMLQKRKGPEENKSAETQHATFLPEVNIVKKWDLPARLKEVSGIAYLDAQRFACIQDEEGIIFIYNLAAGQIEKEIPFAGPGDYEGITVNGNTAYIVRSDGRLYEVDMGKGKNSAQEYKTPLTAKNNIEGLCFDKENNRLLLAEKGGEPANAGYKNIYAFDLARKTLLKEPVFKIDLAHAVFNTAKGKKNKAVMPSAIGIHPLTKAVFVTDGPKSRLLVMDNKGNIRALYRLGKSFAQPEGITFSPQGEIFISNEGTKQPGNIIKVEIR